MFEAALDDAVWKTFGIYDLDDNGIDTMDELRHLTVNLISALNVRGVNAEKRAALVSLSLNILSSTHNTDSKPNSDQNFGSWSPSLMRSLGRRPLQ